MLAAHATLACLNTSGIGTKTTRRAQSLADGNEASASDLASLLARVKNRHARTRLPEKEQIEAGLTKASDILRTCEQSGIEVVVPGDSGYPDSLKGIEDPPPVLYRRGSPNSLRPGVAIVGTRTPSDYGERCARRLGEVFAETGFWVVSGLALGCDQAAHEGCLDAGGQTSAVLAHGLDTVHPTSNQSLAERILDYGGSLWSEHAPGVPPKSHQYVQRNRIQSGLVGGVIVVEAGPDSGTLHTARFAREQGRLLGCLAPGSKESQQLQDGNRKLLREGALPIGGPADIEDFAENLRSTLDQQPT